MGYFPASDSNSVVNQKAVLSRYTAGDGFSSPIFSTDSDVSGVTFDRPNFNRMTAEVEAGDVAAIVVKDMSRLGHDYLKAGYYTGIFFVGRDVRYIVISDGVDNVEGDNDSTPFRSLFNDFYAKDTNKEIRAIRRAQGTAGEHLTKPPYDYIVGPTDRKQWTMNEEATTVVKRVFDLCINEKGPMQIVKILEADNVLIAKGILRKEKREGTPR